jgi:DUF917 family protein
MNGIRPLLVAHSYGGIPTIDGDHMGRAYPRIGLFTPARKEEKRWARTDVDVF